MQRDASLADAPVPAYLTGKDGPRSTMSQTSSTPSPQFASRSAIVAAATIAGILIAGTIALWAHYGSAVFYEMILAGIAACF